MRHVMDHTVGMHAAFAVLAALHRRDATGEGAMSTLPRAKSPRLHRRGMLLMAAAGERTAAHGQRSLPHGAARRLSGERR
jgi:crotonobetainyl-CoA:carnitine CoA-transferase CaiB-like acyl-CoA transferase